MGRRGRGRSTGERSRRGGQNKGASKSESVGVPEVLVLKAEVSYCGLSEDKVGEGWEAGYLGMAKQDVLMKTNLDVSSREFSTLLLYMLLQLV